MEASFWGFLYFPLAVIIIIPLLLVLMKLMEKLLEWFDED